jgi:predicted ArsR family transcriptional regulator
LEFFQPMIVGVTLESVTSRPAALTAAAILADDLRRRMYAFIRRADGPVSRDDAAAAAGISRKLAAFHLDKLVEAGLLRASYARPTGLPRPGRTPKVYLPADIDVQVSIPQREHAALAGILIDAITSRAPAEDARHAALRVATERGRTLGAAERDRIRPGRLGAERALTYAIGMLERYGFEPARAEPTRVWLRNCPFQPLAAHSPDLVCGINQAFLAGFLDGLGASALTAVLVPRPDGCCVELTRRADVAC